MATYPIAAVIAVVATEVVTAKIVSLLWEHI